MECGEGGREADVGIGGFGHDKSLTIRPYAEYYKEHPEERPTMFYAGDGVSDLSAARETDLLFAKKGRGGFADSEGRSCEREGPGGA